MIDEQKIGQCILAIDYGEKRLGLAKKVAGESEVLTLDILDNNEMLWAELKRIMDDLGPSTVVVGLPRGLDGQQTAQSQTVRDFVDDFSKHFDCGVVLQDETLSSEEAAARLPKKAPIKDRRKLLDSIAAQIILEDYLT